MPTWGTSDAPSNYRAWLALVFPALLLNYFGQGALLISDPKAVENPFYLLAPAWACTPGRAGDARYDHRVAGRDLRRVFDHAQVMQLGYAPQL